MKDYRGYHHGEHYNVPDLETARRRYGIGNGIAEVDEATDTPQPIQVENSTEKQFRRCHNEFSKLPLPLTKVNAIAVNVVRIDIMALTQASHSVKVVGKLSAGFAIVVLLVYIVACIVALLSGALCLDTQMVSVFDILYFIYFRDTSCASAPDLETGLTSQHTVFILLLISTVVSFLCFCSAVVLLIILSQDQWHHLNISLSLYTGLYVAVLVVDVTFATHFGQDFVYIGNNHNGEEAVAATTLRTGVMSLLVFTLKGIVTHIFMIVLIILTIWLSRGVRHENIHSLHQFKTPINAFERIPRPVDYSEPGYPLSPVYPLETPRSRSPRSQINDGFILDETHNNNSISRPLEYNGLSYDSRPNFARPPSWRTQQSQPDLSPRPFTYGVPDSLAPSPKPTDTSFDYPPVPEPDYDGELPKMKSALKRTFM